MATVASNSDSLVHLNMGGVQLSTQSGHCQNHKDCISNQTLTVLKLSHSKYFSVVREIVDGGAMEKF